MYLLREGDGGIVVGDLAEGGRVTARQRDAVVYVEDAGGAARGPNDGGGGDYESWSVGRILIQRLSVRTLILLSVDLA